MKSRRPGAAAARARAALYRRTPAYRRGLAMTAAGLCSGYPVLSSLFGG